jgi:ADP-ribose diphosphatase
MLKKWTKLSEETLITNNWWSYKKDAFEIEDGTQGEYHYVHSFGAVMIIPVLPDGRIMLLNQYRYLNRRECLEFPGGGMRKGSEAEDMAQQELQEEAGVSAGHLEMIGSFNPFNGVTNEICKVFVARDLEPVQVKRDATEEFERLLCSKEDVRQRIRTGEIWDGMTLASWQIYQSVTD